jgi:lipopolysaccharide export system protein LptA
MNRSCHQIAALGFSSLPRLPFWVVVFLVTVLLCSSRLGALGQSAEARNFSMAFYHEPPHQLRMRLSLKGERAQPGEKGRTVVTGSPVLVQTFTVTGEPEYVLETPQCSYDEAGHSISSAGPLRLYTADDKFSLDGVGFLWELGETKRTPSGSASQALGADNLLLHISNEVHTVMRFGVAPGASTNANMGPLAGSGSSERMDVYSERFDFDQHAGLGIYRGNVRVAGTNLSSSSGVLIASMPVNTHRLESLKAQEHVVLDYTNQIPLRVTGEQAVYTTDLGRVEMTGHPQWRAEERTGGGDTLVLEISNQVVRATGNSWMTMPGGGLGASGLFAESTRSTGQPKASEGTLDIRSKNYELRTNSAFFSGPVQVRESLGQKLRGSLASDSLSLASSGSNEVQALKAVGNVVITQPAEDGERLLRGGQADYFATNGLLVMSDRPSWQAGTREGRGDLIQIDTRQNRMMVGSNASMRLPAGELHQVSVAGASPPKPRGPAAKPEFADLFSETYVLQETNAVFTGGVYISHTNMSWAGETVTVTFPSGGGRVDTILADGGVAFDVLSDRGIRVHGTGDHAVFNWEVKNGVTNEMVRLVGTPAALNTTNGFITNDILVLDPKKGTLLASGSYALHGSLPPGSTNRMRLPSTRFHK